MKKKRILSWVLSLVMALTVFSIPVASSAADESDLLQPNDGQFRLVDAPGMNGDGSYSGKSYDEVTEFNLLRMKMDEDYYKDVVIQAYTSFEGYDENGEPMSFEGWMSGACSYPCRWHTSNEEVIQFAYYDYDKYKDVDVEGNTYDTEKGTIELKAVGEGEAVISVEIYGYPDTDEETEEDAGPCVVAKLGFTARVSGENNRIYTWNYKTRTHTQISSSPYKVNTATKFKSTDPYEEFDLCTLVRDGDGEDDYTTYTPEGEIRWVSSNPEVACVDDLSNVSDDWRGTGIIYYLSPGDATISVYLDGNLADKVKVTVTGSGWTKLYLPDKNFSENHYAGTNNITMEFDSYPYWLTDHYTLQRKISGSWKTVATGIYEKDGSYFKKKITGLKAATGYDFRVRLSKELHINDKTKLVYGSWKTIKAATSPAKVTLKTLKTKKKSVTATWKKTACTGYQVQISKDKKFKNAKVTQTYKVTKASTLSKKMKKAKSKLKKGTRYYVRVRAYKTYGTTAYGAWSSVKSIKCK